MSSIKLSPNASGTGALTIAAPNTNTDVTFNLGTALGNNGASALVSTDNAGNLGLGVTPSAWGGFTASQVRNGSIASTGNDVFANANCFFNGVSWRYIASATASQYYQDAGSHIWRTAASGTAGNAISFTQAMTLDASGRLTVTAQPSFRARRTGSFTLSNTTYNVIAYDAVDHNYGGSYNNSTGRFTAPVSGTYLFRAHVQPTGSGYSVNIGFQKNGTQLTHAAMGWVSLPGRSDISVETILSLSAGDYIEAAVQISSGTQLFDNHGVFYGHLLA